MTKDGADADHISHLYHGLCARSNVLLRNFSQCNIDVKSLLFRSFCTSFYCMSLVTNYDQRCFNRLRVCYNNSLRMLLGAPRRCSASGLFVSHGLPTFGEIRRKMAYGMLQRLRQTSNSIIYRIVCSGELRQSRWYQDISNCLLI